MASDTQSGFLNLEASKTRAAQERRLTQKDQDSLQTAIGSGSHHADALQPARPASEESLAQADRTPKSRQSLPNPAKPIRIGRYMLLRSETDAVLFRRLNDGGYARVRLVQYQTTPGYRFPTARLKRESLRGRIGRMIAQLLGYLRLPTDPGTKQHHSMRCPHRGQGPSTRPLSANRFRFSAAARTDATAKEDRS